MKLSAISCQLSVVSCQLPASRVFNPTLTTYTRLTTFSRDFLSRHTHVSRLTTNVSRFTHSQFILRLRSAQATHVSRFTTHDSHTHNSQFTIHTLMLRPANAHPCATLRLPFALPCPPAQCSSATATHASQVKRAIQQIEKLPKSKQIEIAKLIQDELSWDATLLQSQDQLASLAKEALKEYKEGKTSDKSW